MASTPVDTTAQVLAALETFTGRPDKAAIEAANKWLQDFRDSVSDSPSGDRLLMLCSSLAILLGGCVGHL